VTARTELFEHVERYITS